jgi:hypothetical protein
MTNKKTLMRMHTKNYDYKGQHTKNLLNKKIVEEPKHKLTVFEKLKKIRT